MGVTLLPRAAVGPALRDGRVAVHGLPLAEARVDTVLIRRHDAHASSALVALLATLQDGRPRMLAAAE